jgi:hypothetical protein
MSEVIPVLPDEVIVKVGQVTSEVSPILPDDVIIVEVRQFISEVNPVSPDDVIVEVRQVVSEVNLSARLPVPPVNTPIKHAA